MKRYTNRTIIDKRAVAVFDILGYREFVKTTKINLIPSFLHELSKLSISSLLDEEFVGYILIADTVVLYSKIPGYFGTTALIVSSSNLLNAFARHEIALRGTLTYGEVFVNKEANVISGKALIKAFELEKEQEWCGAIVDPEYRDIYLKGRNSLPSALHSNLVSYKAPLKKGLRQEFECIGWMHRALMTEKKIYNLFFSNKDERHEVFIKYQNTLGFFRYCYENFLDEYSYLNKK